MRDTENTKSNASFARRTAMAEPEKRQLERPRLLCVICGKPIVTGIHCSQCIDRGFICEGCEGRALADIEEDAS